MLDVRHWFSLRLICEGREHRPSEHATDFRRNGRNRAFEHAVSCGKRPLSAQPDLVDDPARYRIRLHGAGRQAFDRIALRKRGHLRPVADAEAATPAPALVRSVNLLEAAVGSWFLREFPFQSFAAHQPNWDGAGQSGQSQSDCECPLSWLFWAGLASVDRTWRWFKDQYRSW